jgi:hypothetical protein
VKAAVHHESHHHAAAVGNSVLRRRPGRLAVSARRFPEMCDGRRVDGDARVGGHAGLGVRRGEGGCSGEPASHIPADAKARPVSPADPLGARARFLTAVNKAALNKDEPVRLCEACVQSLPVQRAGITVHVDDVGLEVLCASDYLAERVEWVQVSLGEGPAWDAMASGGPVLASNLTKTDDRWPVFAAEAAASGVGAMYSLPLQIGAVKVGVLDLYRDDAAPLASSDFADAVAIADLATAILLTVGRSGRVTEALGPWWDQPLSTREVHQATGMIMAQLNIDAREAYVRLQAHAFTHRRLIRDVAHDVVDRRLRFNSDPDADLDPDPLVPQ